MFTEITDLIKLSDAELHNETLKLAKLERSSEVLIITHLIAMQKTQAHHRLGFYGLPEYCERALGFSNDVAKKRSQVVNIVFYYPKFFHLLKEGKTHVTNIALCANRVTQANEKMLFEFLPGKPSSDLRFYLSRLTNDGKLKDKPETIAMKLDLDRETHEMFKRARDLISKDSRGVEPEAVLRRLLEDFLERKDPIRRSKRLFKKNAEKCRAAPDSAAKCHAAPAQEPVVHDGVGNNLAVKESPAEPKCNVTPTRHIPMATRHAVFERDGGRCTFVGPDGKRCERTSGLQIDHIKMYAEGGTHDMSNLRLMCTCRTQSTHLPFQ